MPIKLNQLKNHQGFRKHFKNISWLFLEKILRIVSGLFIGIWVARYLGPEKFGLLNYAQSFVGLFSAIATLGLNTILVREFINHPNQEKELLGTSFLLRLFGTILTLIILCSVIYFTPNNIYTKILMLIIALRMFFQPFSVIDFYFQSKVMSKYVVFANITSLLASSIIKIVLIINNAPLIAFAWILVFDAATSAGAYLYWYYKIKKEFFLSKIKFSINLAKYLFKNSWSLILSSIVISIYLKIDQVMIKEMLGNNEVGQYAAAVRISEAWYFIPVIITTSFFPSIVSTKQQNKKLYYARLQKLYDLMAIISLSIAIPMTFISDGIINLLYGIQYNAAGKVLMVHIWASIFIFFDQVSGRWLLSENYQIYSFYRYLVGAISNIILNIFLIKFYGIVGAAYATLFSYFISTILLDYFFRKMKPTFYMKIKAICLLNILNKIKGG